MSLSKFYETIEVADQILGSAYKAYRMDKRRNTPDMRSFLGLGSCHCCDYFLISKHVVLIEEKRLSDKVKEIKNEVAYLSEDDKEDYALRELIRRLCLKVYGSLFMLSRLSLQCGELSRDSTKHDFWFVDSGWEERNAKYFQYIKARLLSDLRSNFTRNFIEEVSVMRAGDLKRRLDNAPAT